MKERHWIYQNHYGIALQTSISWVKNIYTYVYDITMSNFFVEILASYKSESSIRHCNVSPYFVNRVYFSKHNNAHNDEKSGNFQNQKFIDETDHIKVRVISQIRTNLYTSSL